MKRVRRLVGPGGERLTLVGGILGLESDAAVAEAEFLRDRPAAVLLGVPFEDLDTIRATAGQEAAAEFSPNELDDAYLGRLRKFGPTRMPPADLYRLFAMASAASLPVESIDLGDEAHSESYTKHVGFWEVVRTNRAQKRLPDREFASADAETFALEWDEALNATKGVRRVQADREAFMVERILRAASPTGPTLALLPLPRLAGVAHQLLASGWREDAKEPASR